MSSLKKDIKNCKICEAHLEMGCNPVCSFSSKSKIVIIGQAPGLKVHQSGVPWDDKSGDNLRKWMQVTKEEFYDESLFAIVPMGFCYPGKGKSGDLPPRKECAPQWHELIWQELKGIELILLIGSYAQNYYLAEQKQRTLTETVKNFNDYLPRYFVLPHPSPRNNIWQKKNPWFPQEVLPALADEVTRIKNSIS